MADASKGRRDPSSEESVVRDIPEPTFLTTAQKRTKTNMFG